MRILLLLFCTLVSIQAQEDPLQFYRTKLARTQPGNQDDIRELLDIAGNYRAFTHYLLATGAAPGLGTSLLQRNWTQLIREYENSRLDKQIGVAPLVTRATAPALLGLASESGALTRDVKSNLLTFRGNAGGLARFLLGQDIFPCCEPGGSPLRNASVSVSLDPLNSQIVGFGIRYAILNTRDVRSDAVKVKWAQRLLADTSNNSGRVLAAIGTAYETVESNPDYEAWLDRATAQLSTASEAELVSGLEAQLDTLALRIRSLDPALDDKLIAVLTAYESYGNNHAEFFRDVTEKPAISVEYSQVKTSTRSLRVICETNPARGRGIFTANAGLTIDGTLRRWDAAAQYDHPIAASTFLTVAGGYDGTNFIGEAGLTFRFSNSGVRIPIGLVWFDRNRGAAARVGIALDMDTLFMNPK